MMPLSQVTPRSQVAKYAAYPLTEPEVLIVLNDGSYQSISLTAWMASNPHLLLATNFRVPEAAFKDFPTRERFMPG
jgi:hypothetical protein